MKSTQTYILIFFFVAGFLQPGFLFSQEKKPRKIEIIHANSLEFNEKINPDVRRFIGDVIFQHNDFNMYCDSAYFYSKSNRIDAFDNVHIERGDTLHLYGDYLSYNGNTSFGKVRNNVKLEDKEASLFTDSLNFDSNINYAHYFEGGKIVNEDKTITSVQGDYYSNRKMAYFKDSVVVKSPEYTVYSDTLNYNTEKETAYFVGPTDIESDSSSLYCEQGWYKTRKKEFLFTKNAVYRKKDRILKGDTLYYDDPSGFGQIKQNAEIIDTSRKIILRGHYSEYTENPQTAFLTDSTLMIHIDSDNDSLFLHADTLRTLYDSTETYRIFKAYYKVKFYKSSLQGTCDSLTYSLEDSIIRMFRDPVLWADSNQISADTIRIFTKNNEISKFRLIDAAFIVNQEDTGKYNQIKGAEMTGYVKNNELQRVFVDGNGETIYFTKDGEEIVGMNKAVSSSLMIYLKENQVARINMIKDPNGTLFPLKDAKEKELSGFRWLEWLRPVSREDIYIWRKKEPSEDHTVIPSDETN